jgi:ribonucleoside-diphosphate reductase beta chain
MRDVANIQNNGNISGKYPLFLGEDQGFADSINVTYPILEELYEEQMGQFWRETEFNLSNDKQELKTCDAATRDVMVINLMSQWLLDSVASRSIMSLLEPFTTNNELTKVLQAWSLFEGIHASAYSLIIRKCFDDPNEVIEKAKADMHVAYRSAVIRRVFNETATMAAEYQLNPNIDIVRVKKQLLKTIFAIYTLEAVSFMASFACTFALTETGKFQGIGNEITAICKDELLHARFGRAIQSIMMSNEGYDWIFQEIKYEIKEIFDECVMQEFSFTDYVFSNGRHVLGVTPDMFKDYTRFLAAPMYSRVGLKFDTARFGEVPEKNPLPYMDKYVKPDLIQAAAQEIEIVNYRVAQIENDVDDAQVFEFKGIL